VSGIRRQALAVARRDLARERRRGEVLWVTVPFGIIALLLVPLAIGTDQATLHRVGPGLYWVVVLLFGVLVGVRGAADETGPQRDAAALLGLDPVAVFAGRALATSSLLVVFELVVGVAAIALYDIDLIGVGWLALVVLLVAIGLGTLATIASSIVASGAGTAALVPLLVAPLAIPLLLGATQSLDGLRQGTSILSWILLMIVVVLVLGIVGVVSSGPLQESR